VEWSGKAHRLPVHAEKRGIELAVAVMLLQLHITLAHSSQEDTVAALALSRVALKVKVKTFIYCRLQGNQNSSGLQCEVAY